MRLAIVLVLLAGLNSAIGNALLKQSRLTVGADAGWIEQYFSIYFIGAVAFYLINLGLFAKALDSIPVSIGYPILATSGFAILVLVSHFAFGERVGGWQAAGFLLVVAGIACLARGTG